MALTMFVRRRWKLLLNFVTVLALAVVIFALRGQLVQTLHDLTRVTAWVLVLLIPIEVLNYHAQAKLYQKLFAIIGSSLPYRDLVKIALELNFVNYVFPSAGVSGLSYFGIRLRRYEMKVSRATLVQTTKLLLTFASFELLLFLGLFMLAVAGQVNDLLILIASVLIMSILFGTLVFVYVIGSQARIHGFLTGATRVINRLVQLVRPAHHETINIAKARDVFEEFHQDYLFIQSRWRGLKAPFLWAFVANLSKVLAIYVVYLAFGKWVNIGAVIVAHAVANVAGLVSVLPGGVGLYEVLMTATLAAAGIPAALSLPVTVMYRVLAALLQLPPGAVLYYHNLHQPETQEVR